MSLSEQGDVGRLGEWDRVCGKAGEVGELYPEVRIISTRFSIQISKSEAQCDTV